MGKVKKVVVRVSTGAGDRRRSVFKSILINLAKVMVPFDSLWEKLAPTPAENKSTAMKIAVSLPGVQGVSFEGDNKDQLVVKGDVDQLDPFILIKKLREKISSADIVTVGSEKEEEKKKKDEPDVVYSYPYYHYGGHPWQLMEIADHRSSGWCF